MKQMQGFMAQFARAIKMATGNKYRKLHDCVSHALKILINPPIARGSQQTANPNTIAMAIFNTFRSLCCRCSPALTDCSPGLLCDLSLKKIMM